MPAREFNLPAHRRGDTIYVAITDVLDETGSAVVLSNYTVRATLKLPTDTASNDSSALSTVTGGSGITVSGNDLTVRFPASATASISPPITLKYEVQVTKTADTDEVRTLVYGDVPIDQDVVKTSP